VPSARGVEQPPPIIEEGGLDPDGFVAQVECARVEGASRWQAALTVIFLSS
jgi:hypothetical protein